MSDMPIRSRKTERQHLHGRMPVDERADRLGREHHDRRPDHDRRNHHPQLVDHPDRGDHRVERKDDVEQHDLDDARWQTTPPHARSTVPFLPFEPVVDLVGALGQQEQAAADQDQIAAGDRRGRGP